MKIENKVIASIVVLTIILAAFGLVSSGLEDPIPSTKAAVAGSDTAFIPPGELSEFGDNFTNKIIAEAYIHTTKDLAISVSAESILYTKTGIKGKPDKESKASATLLVWAEVDGNKAFPCVVTFAERIQIMDGSINDTDWINMSLQTTEANTFNFIALDVDKVEVGQPHTHHVTIHATVLTDEQMDGSNPLNEAIAWGAIGKRTVVIEEMDIKGLDDNVDSKYCLI